MALDAILRARQVVEERKAKAAEQGIETSLQRQERVLAETAYAEQALESQLNASFAALDGFRDVKADTRDGFWGRAEDRVKNVFYQTPAEAAVGIKRRTPGGGSQVMTPEVTEAINTYKQIEAYQEDVVNLRNKLQEDVAAGVISQKNADDTQRNAEIGLSEIRRTLTPEMQKTLSGQAQYNPIVGVGKALNYIGSVGNELPDIFNYSPIGAALNSLERAGKNVQDTFTESGFGNFGTEYSVLDAFKTNEAWQDYQQGMDGTAARELLYNGGEYSDQEKMDIAQLRRGSQLRGVDYENTASDYYTQQYRAENLTDEALGIEDDDWGLTKVLKNIGGELGVLKNNPDALGAMAGDQVQYFIPAMGVGTMIAQSDTQYLDNIDTIRGEYSQGSGEYLLSDEEKQRAFANQGATLGTQIAGQRLLNKMAVGSGANKLAPKIAESVRDATAGTVLGRAGAAASNAMNQTALRRGAAGLAGGVTRAAGVTLADGTVEGGIEALEASLQNRAMGGSGALTRQEFSESFAGGFAMSAGISAAGQAVAGTGRLVDTTRSKLRDRGLIKLDNSQLLDTTNPRTFRPDLVVEKNTKALSKDMSFEEMQVVKQEIEIANFLMQDEVNLLKQEQQQHQDINAEIEGVVQTIQAGNLEPETEASLERRLHRLRREKASLTSERTLERAIPDAEARLRKTAAQTKNTSYRLDKYASENNRNLIEGWDGNVFSETELPEARTLERADIFDTEARSERDNQILADLGIDTEIFDTDSPKYDPVKATEELSNKITEESSAEAVRLGVRLAALNSMNMEEGSNAYDTAKQERDGITRSNRRRKKENQALRAELADPNTTAERKTEIQEQLRTNARITGNLAKRGSELDQQMADNKYAKDNLQEAKNQEQVLKTKAANLEAENRKEADKSKKRIEELEEKLEKAEASEATAREAGDQDAVDLAKKEKEQYYQELADERKRLIRLIGARKSDVGRGDLEQRSTQLIEDGEVLDAQQAELDSDRESLASIEEEINEMEATITDFNDRVDAGQNPLEAAEAAGIPRAKRAKYLSQSFDAYIAKLDSLIEEAEALSESIDESQQEYDEASQAYKDAEEDFNDDLLFTEASVGQERDAADITVKESRTELMFARDSRKTRQEERTGLVETIKDNKARIKEFVNEGLQTTTMKELRALVKKYGFDKYAKRGDLTLDIALNAEADLVTANQDRIDTLDTEIADLDTTVADIESRLGDEVIQADIEEQVLRETREDRSVDDAVELHDQTTKELKQAENLQKDIDELTDSIDAIEASLDGLNNSDRLSAEEDIKELETERDAKQSELEDLDVDTLNEVLAEQEAVIEEAVEDESITDKKLLTRAKKILKASRDLARKVSEQTEGRRLSNITDRFRNLNVSKVNFDDEDLKNLSGSSIVSGLKGLLKSSNHELTQAEVDELIDLARILDEETQALNELKDTNAVSAEIFEGGPGFTGLNEYEANIAEAIADGNLREVLIQSRRLNNFVSGHNNKAAAARQALDTFNDTGNEQIIYRKKNSNSQWVVDDLANVNMTPQSRAATGALNINAASDGLVENIAFEAGALSTKNAAIRNLTSKLTNPTTTTTSSSNTNTNTGTGSNTGGTGRGNAKQYTPPTQEEVDELGHFVDRDTNKGGKDLFLNTAPLNSFKRAPNGSPDIDVFPNDRDDNDTKIFVPELMQEAIPDDSVDGGYKMKTHPYLYDNVDGDGVVFNSQYKATQQAMADDSNKTIAFGSDNLRRSSEGRLGEAFAGRDNASMNYGIPYTSDDVIAYDRDNGANESVEIARARKAELDKAIEAGATFRLPTYMVDSASSQRNYQSDKLNKDIGYLEDNGYQEEFTESNGRRLPTGFFKPKEAIATDSLDKHGNDKDFYNKQWERRFRDKPELLEKAKQAYQKHGEDNYAAYTEDGYFFEANTAQNFMGFQEALDPHKEESVDESIITDETGDSIDDKKGQKNKKPTKKATKKKKKEEDEDTDTDTDTDSDTDTDTDVEDTSVPVGFSLSGDNFHTPKDQKKADMANAYIGFATEGSTAKYYKDAREHQKETPGFVVNNQVMDEDGNLVPASINADTVAFVSVSGVNRSNQDENFDSTLEAVKEVLDAGGTIIADNPYHRNRKHNKGEQRLYDALFGMENSPYDIVEVTDKGKRDVPSIITKKEVGNGKNGYNARGASKDNVIAQNLYIQAPATGKGKSRKTPSKITEDRWIHPVLPAVEFNEEDVANNEAKIPGTNTKVLKQKGTTLNSEANLFKKYIATKDYEKLAELAGFEELTEAHKIQLDSFIRLHHKMEHLVGKAIANPHGVTIENFDGTTVNLEETSLYKHLVKTNGQRLTVANENITTALTLGLFQYLQSNGKVANLDVDGVKAAHGINPETIVSGRAVFKLGKYGGHRGFLFQEIGQSAVAALGLDAADEGHQYLRQDLESTMGALAYTIAAQDAVEPMFTETHMSHRKQIEALADVMSIWDLKKHLIDLDDNNGIGFFPPQASGKRNSSIKDFQSKVRTKHHLKKYLDTWENSKSGNAKYYLKSQITLSKPAIDMSFSKGKAHTWFHPEVLDVVKSSERTDGSKDLLDNLFGTNRQKVEPLDEAPTKLFQKTVKKSDTGIPDNMEEAILKAAQNPWIIQSRNAEAMLNMYDSDPEALYQLMGVKPEAEIAKLHPTLRDSVMTDNAIKRDLMDQQINWLKDRRAVDEETGNVSYKDFYQMPVVWVNQRVGYESTLFNAQTDLFARMLSGMKAWETEVDVSEEIVSERGQPLNKHSRFLLALAENMEGLADSKVTFTDDEGDFRYDKAAQTVDKVEAHTFLTRFVEYLENDAELQAAIESIYTLEEGNATSTDYANISTVVNEFDMGELGFGALVEYAHYARAKKEGVVHKTSIGTQSDGITNGPTITKYLLNASDRMTKRRGGILTVQDLENGVDNFFRTKAPTANGTGTKDLYQVAGDGMGDMLASYIYKSHPMRAVTDSLSVIDDNFGSRSWAKKLTTPFNYGAGTNSLRRAITNRLLTQLQDSYYHIYTLEGKERDDAIAAFNKTVDTLVKAYNDNFTYTAINSKNKRKEVLKLITIFNSGKKLNSGPPFLRQIDYNGNTKTDVLVKELLSKYAYLDKGKFEKWTVDQKLEHINEKLRPVKSRTVKDSKTKKNKTVLEPTNIVTAKYLQIDPKKPNLEKDFNSELEAIVTEMTDATLSTASTKSIEVAEKAFIETRDMLNKLTQDGFKNFKAVEQIVALQLGFDLDNLTKKQKQVLTDTLKPYRAAVASGMSNLDGSKTIANGINMVKVENTLRAGQAVQFGNLKGRGKKPEYKYGYAYYAEVDPGVSTMPMIIQSIDAAISVLTISEFAAMNFHDANVFGLDYATEGIQAQNENFYKSVINYAPGIQILNAKLRPLYMYKELLANTGTKPEVREAIYKEMVKIISKGQSEAILSEIEFAYDMELAKLHNAMADGVIHQYGGHNGQWVIPDSYKQMIQDRITEIEQAKTKNTNAYRDMFDNYVKLVDEGDTGPGDSFNTYDVLRELDSDSQQDILDGLIQDEVSLVEMVEYMKNLDPAYNTDGAQPAISNLLEDLQDSTLKDVKIIYRDKSLKPDSELNRSNDIRYSRFTNSIVVNKTGEVNPKQLAKVMLEASLHNNLKAAKNGSTTNPDLTNRYRGLKLVLANIDKYADRAVAEGKITKAEQKTLLAELGSGGKLGNVENLVTELMYGNEKTGINAILANIPNYGDIGPTSLMEKIFDLLTGFFVNKKHINNPEWMGAYNKTLRSVLLTESQQLTRDLVNTRKSKTITQMIRESFEDKRENPYTAEETHGLMQPYDGRLQLELYKAKVVNDGKPLNGKQVLDLIDSAISTTNDTAFERELKPIVDLLKTGLPNAPEVVLADSIEDFLALGHSHETIADNNIEELITIGTAFEYQSNGKSIIVLPTSSASSNPNLRASTIIHELLHSYTREALRDPKNKKVIDGFIELRKKAKVSKKYKDMVAAGNVPKGIEYALNGDKDLSLVDEFVVQTLTNKEARDFLEQLDIRKEFFDRVSDAVTYGGNPITHGLDAFTEIFGDFLYNQPNKIEANVVRPDMVANQGDYSVEYADPMPAHSDWSLKVQQALLDRNLVDDNNAISNILNRFETNVLPNHLARHTKEIFSLINDWNAEYFKLNEDGSVPKGVKPGALRVGNKVYKGADLAILAHAKADNFSEEDINRAAAITEVGRLNEILNATITGILKSPSATLSNTNVNEVYEPDEVFDALSRHSQQDNSYLREVIIDIVNPMMKNLDPEYVSGYDKEKIWFEAIANDKNVYSTKAMDAGFQLDTQQAYALEVLEVALRNTIGELTGTAVYRQLERAYNVAKKQLSIEDFHTGNWDEAIRAEREIAAAKYNHLFATAYSADETSDYLTNFISMVLVDKELQQVMSINPDTTPAANRDVYEAAVDMFGRVVEFVEEQSSNVSYRDSIANQVTGLAEQLGTIYYKTQDDLIEKDRDLASKLDDTVSGAVDGFINKAKDLATDITSSSAAQSTAAGRLANRVLTTDLTDMDKAVNDLMDDVRGPGKTLGEGRELFNDIVGTLDNEEHRDARDLFRNAKQIEIKRGAIIEDVTKAIKNSFAEDNRDLSREQDKAITNTFLHTDMQTLLDDYSFDDVMNFLEDRDAMRSEIAKLESEVEGLPYSNEMLIRSKALATYMVYGKSTIPFLAKNALAIVERAGIPGATAPDMPGGSRKRVDKLVSMYALELTRTSDRDLIKEIWEIEKEDNTNPMTGLEYTVRSHKAFAKESLELFQDNPYSMTKGYMPNITNPQKGFEVVSPEDLDLYESMGYVRQGDVNDKALGSKGFKHIMTVSNNGKQKYVSGALSIEQNARSGTELVSRMNDGVEAVDKYSTQAMKQHKRLVAMDYKDFVPNTQDSFLVPTIDVDGRINAYNYEMAHASKDAFLDRNNSSSTLLGQFKGANINKKLYPSHNERVVDYFIKSYDDAQYDLNDYTRNKFVHISPNATDKKNQDRWHSLPRATQLYIMNQTGKEELFVRNDELNLMFGFRKLDVSKLFDKEVFERNILEHVYATVTGAAFGDKAKLRHNQMHAFWMDAIKELKDYIVIRNLKVLMGNIMSNTAFLVLNDSDIKTSIKDIKDALTYSMKYQKDMQAFNTLQHEMKIGYSDSKGVARLMELKDAINKNPLKPFIDAGMMPMIVNDMSFKQGEVEYEGAFATAKRAVREKIPGPLGTVVDTLLVEPGTPAYSFLSNATQQSDFVFKYAIYKQERRKGKKERESLDRARQVFIDYDVPTSVGMQALNDNGLWMFSKFSTRIMRVLAMYAKESPGKLALEHMISSEVLGNPSLMSLNMVGQAMGGRTFLNNPTDDVLTMMDNAFPIAMMKGLF